MNTTAKTIILFVMTAVIAGVLFACATTASLPAKHPTEVQGMPICSACHKHWRGTWGLGEAVVGGAVNPDTLVVDNASGQVIERHIADKQVMTVRVDGATQEKPVPPELRCAPVLDDSAAPEFYRLGMQIEQIYAMPMDIEWALADGKFAILQARPITALAGAEEPITLEWKPPNPKGQYLRMSAVDLMPDPLSPLFTSVGLPALISGVNKLARRLIRFASEDVGNADPQALVLAIAARDAIHFLGIPEGKLALAQLAAYLG